MGDDIFTALNGSVSVTPFEIPTFVMNEHGEFVTEPSNDPTAFKEMDAVFAARLSKVLLDPSTYNGDNDLCFKPGIAYDFHNGQKYVRVKICFGCKHVQIGDKLLNLDPKLGVPPLIRLSKEAFPDLKWVQEMKE